MSVRPNINMPQEAVQEDRGRGGCTPKYATDAEGMMHQKQQKLEYWYRKQAQEQVRLNICHSLNGIYQKLI